MLLKIKARKEKERQEKGLAPSGAARGANKASAALLRLTTDHNELSLPPSCKIEFDDPNDLHHFRLVLEPDEGMYRRGRFYFNFDVGMNYPHEVPKVLCATKCYHPNIDKDGNICLNILREDWRPVLNLQSIIFGLVFLFLEPNMDDPLHKEAANVMRSNRSQFERNIAQAMGGGTVQGTTYDHCLR